MKFINEIKERKFGTEQDLLEFSKHLENSSLRNLIDENILSTYKPNGKGGLGQIVEKLYFGYEPNSRQEADFFLLNRELKVAPLKEIKKNPMSDDLRTRLGYSAKERIVITIINYLSIVNETWDQCSLKNKIRLLIIFYLHKADVDRYDYIFKLVELWEPSLDDLKIIKSDWEKITDKIKRGEAHNLSEGDTLYLGACTKGSSALGSLRNQPFSEIKAPQRAFCFKNSYVNSIISELYAKKNNVTEKQIKLLSPLENSLEDSLNRIFSKYKNSSLKEICEKLNIEPNLNSKQFYNTVVNRMLGGRGDSAIVELEKAGIKPKVFRIDNSNKMPESISFPTFDFIELANENWNESSLKDMLESTKFLFVVFKMSCKNMEYKNLGAEEKIEALFLEKIILWNMPIETIESSVRQTWEKTKDVILQGVPREVRGNKVFNDFPSSTKEYNVVHVRPHARNREDTFPLPNGDSFTKQCFWLSKEYIEKIINE